MTLVIKLSQIKSAADFDAQVQAYIKARKDHQKTVGEPAPTAPAIVEAAVRKVPGSIDPPRADDYVADYTIEDDTPPPPTLDERKAALAQAAAVAAMAAIDAVSPPLLRRLMNMDTQDAMAVEEAKRTPEQKSVIEASAYRQTATRAIHFQLAHAEAAIHDLTDKTIDAWKAPTFGA
jgi:hypothetical protein